MIKPDKYYFSPSAVSMNLNAQSSGVFTISETIQVVVSMGAAVRVANQLTTEAGKVLELGYNAQLGYRQFSFTGANTVLGYPGNKYIGSDIYAYIRLDASDNGANGELVFLPYMLDYDGTVLGEGTPTAYEDIPLESKEDEEGNTYYAMTNSDDENASGLTFYYIHIASISKPDSGKRNWLDNLNNGQLDTAKGNNEKASAALEKMFKLVNNVIHVLLPLDKITFQKSGTAAFIDRIITTVSESLDDFAAWASTSAIATTASVASYLSAQLKSLDSRFFRKDQDDASPHTATFGNLIIAKLPLPDNGTSSGNLSVEGNSSVKGDMNVEGKATVEGEASIGDNATLKGGSNKIVGDVTFGKEGTDTEYTEGVKGCKIYFNGSGWAIDTDYLSVNKRMYAKSIQVDEVDHVGGQIILTDASCVADKVEDKEEYYRVYFRAKNGEGRKVYNQWRVGDQAYCQIFNIEKGDTEDTEDTEDFTNRYYWRLVVGVGSGDEFHYIDLSKRYYDISGDLKMDNDAGTTPMPDDPIVQLGYRRQSGDDDEFVKQRQGATMISGGGRQGRSIRMWEKIDSFNLPTPRVLISPSNVEMTLNKLSIKTIGDDDDEEVKDVIDYVQEFQEQFHIFELDTSEIPTLENEPYITWTDTEKVRYSTPPNNAVVINSDGRTWRFIVTDGVYSFEEFTDPWLLAQHKDLQTILDDNVIAADEKPTFIEMGKRIAQESVQEKNKYQAVTSPSTALTTAYTNYTSAITALMTVLASIKNLTPPIHLKTDTEDGDIAYTRDGLQSLVVTYDVRLAAWRDAYEDFKRDKSSTDTLEEAKEYVDDKIADITEKTTDEHINRLINDFTEGKFNKAYSQIEDVGYSVKVVTNWIGEDALKKKPEVGMTGMITYLNELFVGTSSMTFDPETGDILNYSKAGLVTTTNFASVFAEETGKDGETVSAILSAFVKDETSNIVITAENVFIASGSPAFSNYFKLENGNVTMQDLLCRNITVEGVINNLIDNLELRRTDLGSYNQYDTPTFFLDPLKCGSVIRLGIGAGIGKIVFPVAYLGEYGAVSDGVVAGYSFDNDSQILLAHRHSFDDLRQCLGKKIWILNEMNAGLVIQAGGGSTTAGAPLLMVKNDMFGNTLDLSEVSENSALTQTVSMVSSYVDSTHGSFYNYILECKMGKYKGRECIYWELVGIVPKLDS